MMRIGELAQRSGLSASRIRFYEAEGLLKAVDRTANGYRAYAADALVILDIIASAQRTGFTLDEIRQILPASPGNWPQSDLLDVLRRKMTDIEDMEKRLRQSRKQLQALIRQIEDKPAGLDCADNARRLLKEFVPHGSTAAARPKRSAATLKRR